MSKKIYERIVIVGDPKNLLKYFDRDQLPEEYGGLLPELEFDALYNQMTDMTMGSTSSASASGSPGKLASAGGESGVDNKLNANAAGSKGKKVDNSGPGMQSGHVDIVDVNPEI